MRRAGSTRRCTWSSETSESFTAKTRYGAIICDRLLHSIADVQAMLDKLVAHLEEDGRIYLTCFNFLWGLPLAVASRLRLIERSPPENWFSESTLHNLFSLSGLEPVYFEDRILVPFDVPSLNKFVAQFPPFRYGSLYRTYVLRRRRVHRESNPTVSVIVPARNEAKNIAGAVARTPLMGARTEIVFVEGGSTDGTWDEIQRAIGSYGGPLHLAAFRQSGKGKGDAVRLGFEKATGSMLMILDADLTVPPEELPKFYHAMSSGLTDYVHGTRMVYPMEDEAMRFLNKAGNAFFAKTFSFLLGQALKDTLCGTKVIWKTDYERLARRRAYFGELDPFGDFDLIFGARKLKSQDHGDSRSLQEPRLRRDEHLPLPRRNASSPNDGARGAKNQVRLTKPGVEAKTLRRERPRSTRRSRVDRCRPQFGGPTPRVSERRKRAPAC